MGINTGPANRITRAGIAASNEPEEIYLRWYHRFLLMFAALALAVIVGVSLDSSVSNLDRSIVISTVVGMALWFWFVGQWSAIKSDLQAVIYLLGNVVGITICIRVWETSSLLLFALYWMGFAYLHTRYALVYALLLTISTQWAFGSIGSNIGFNLDTLVAATLLVLLLGFSAMMARYIEAFHIEAERNAALVNELKRTQQSLVEREREAGIEQERRRMAGEIHDTIAQHFASIITNLRAASEVGSRDPVVTQKHLDHAFSAAQQGIVDSRAMLSTMQPDVLLGRTLADVLKSMVDDWSEYALVGAKFREEGYAANLSRDQEALLVRGLQESLRNIGKHAQASEVQVALSWLEDEMLLDISDNGLGFDPTTVNSGADGYHMGLLTMESRVQSAGGTFALESSPGDGTSIAISFPTGEIL